MSDPILKVAGLSMDFGGVRAVDNLGFWVDRQEIMGIIGPNGAGKSTTFDLLTGLQRPSAGEIFFNGKQLVGLKPHEINRLGIGRTFQKIKIFPGLSVLENAMVGAFCRVNDVHKAVKKAGEVLQLVGLYEQKAKMAGNLTLVDRKKLELARALCTDPQLLLVDELMCGLNVQETEEGIELLKRINGMGITIVLVEHMMDVILSLTHRVIVLNYGVKITEGPPEAVVSDEQVVEAYLGGGIDVCYN